jgi:hypothetical protein
MMRVRNVIVSYCRAFDSVEQRRSRSWLWKVLWPRMFKLGGS